MKAECALDEDFSAVFFLNGRLCFNVFFLCVFFNPP